MVLPDNDNKPLALTFMVCRALIYQDGKILLLQEKKPSVYGKWSLPGGKVDEGESFEQALTREVREECGLSISVTKHLFTQQSSVDRPIFHVFSAKVTGGNLKHDKDEILDAKWFAPKDVISLGNDLRTPELTIPVIDIFVRTK